MAAPLPLDLDTLGVRSLIQEYAKTMDEKDALYLPLKAARATWQQLEQNARAIEGTQQRLREAIAALTGISPINADLIQRIEATVEEL